MDDLILQNDELQQQRDRANRTRVAARRRKQVLRDRAVTPSAKESAMASLLGTQDNMLSLIEDLSFMPPGDEADAAPSPRPSPREAAAAQQRARAVGGGGVLRCGAAAGTTGAVGAVGAAASAGGAGAASASRIAAGAAARARMRNVCANAATKAAHAEVSARLAASKTPPAPSLRTPRPVAAAAAAGAVAAAAAAAGAGAATGIEEPDSAGQDSPAPPPQLRSGGSDAAAAAATAAGGGSRTADAVADMAAAAAVAAGEAAAAGLSEPTWQPSMAWGVGTDGSAAVPRSGACSGTGAATTPPVRSVVATNVTVSRRAPPSAGCTAQPLFSAEANVAAATAAAPQPIASWLEKAVADATSPSEARGALSWGVPPAAAAPPTHPSSKVLDANRELLSRNDVHARLAAFEGRFGAPPATHCRPLPPAATRCRPLPPAAALPPA